MQNSMELVSINNLDRLKSLDHNFANIKDYSSFAEAIEIENECFQLIKMHGAILQQETHEALVYVYGSILSYLLVRGSQDYLSWLRLCEQIIRARVFYIQDDISKAGAEEHFTKSLNISVLCDEEGNMAGDMDKFIENQQLTTKMKDMGKKIDTAVNIGGAIISAGIAVGTGGFGLILIPILLASASYIGANELYKNSCSSDFYDYYIGVFIQIKNEFVRIKPYVKGEIDYFRIRCQQIEESRKIYEELLISIKQGYAELNNKKDRSNDDEELLQLTGDLIKESDKARDFLSEEEKKQLKEQGFEVEGISEEEAASLRELIAPAESSNNLDANQLEHEQIITPPSNNNLRETLNYTLLPPPVELSVERLMEKTLKEIDTMNLTVLFCSENFNLMKQLLSKLTERGINNLKLETQKNINDNGIQKCHLILSSQSYNAILGEGTFEKLANGLIKEC